MIRNVLSLLAFLFGLTGWIFAAWLYFGRPAVVSPPLWSPFFPTQPSVGVEYKDFIPILLTALGVLITVLATVLGAAALFGYTVIREAAVSSATREAVAAAQTSAVAIAKRTATEVATTTVRELNLQAETSGDDEDQYGTAAGGSENDR